MTFEVIPAIDLLGGRCVRLSQGRYDQATVYEEDPSAQARRFAALPIPRLHVVDLDGAKAGKTRNRPSIEAIVGSLGDVPVQTSGGLRTVESIEALLDIGVDRVVLGTAALRDPDLVKESAARFPGRIVVGIDARDGRVAVQGWLETSEVRVIDVARRFEDAGVAAIVHTDISRDGMGTGPNLEASAELAAAVEVPVIASGGVGSEDDVTRAFGYASRGIAGIIIGRALYTGAVRLERALEIATCS